MHSKNVNCLAECPVHINTHQFYCLRLQHWQIINPLVQSKLSCQTLTIMSTLRYPPSCSTWTCLLPSWCWQCCRRRAYRTLPGSYVVYAAPQSSGSHPCRLVNRHTHHLTPNTTSHSFPELKKLHEEWPNLYQYLGGYTKATATFISIPGRIYQGNSQIYINTWEDIPRQQPHSRQTVYFLRRRNDRGPADKTLGSSFTPGHMTALWQKSSSFPGSANDFMSGQWSKLSWRPCFDSQAPLLPFQFLGNCPIHI